MNPILDDPVNSCPGCKHRVLTRRDVLYARLDGTVSCRVCGQTARVGLFARWLISCLIAMVLPIILLYGDVFYSGHLFLVSLFVVFGAWRALTFIAWPFVDLETVPGSPAIPRGQSILILAILAIASMAIDGMMASRFENPEERAGTERSQRADR